MPAGTQPVSEQGSKQKLLLERDVAAGRGYAPGESQVPVGRHGAAAGKLVGAQNRVGVHCNGSHAAVQGLYYYNSNCAPIQPSKLARDPLLAAWLWDWSAQQVGLPASANLPPATDEAADASK